jgi:hypothetical protein
MPIVSFYFFFYEQMNTYLAGGENPARSWYKCKLRLRNDNEMSIDKKIPHCKTMVHELLPIQPIMPVTHT